MNNDIDNSEYYEVENISESNPKKIFKNYEKYERLRQYMVDIDSISQKIGTGIQTIKIVKNFMTEKDCDKLKYSSYKTVKFLTEIEVQEANKLKHEYKQKIMSTCQDLFNIKVINDDAANKPHIDTFYVFGRMPKYVTEIHCDIVGENEDETYKKYMWSGHMANLVYLNDDYEGGEIYFPEYDLKIKPEKGMLISFPGNYLNRHGIFPASNQRYTMSVFVKCVDFE